MKPAVILCLLAPLLTAVPQYPLVFSVNVQGVDNRNVLKDGVEPDELANLTINVDGKSLYVDEFDVIHARGKSPVGSMAVKGNSCNLSSFRKKAKSGDRLVIDIKRVVDHQQHPIESGQLVVQIPIK